MPAISAGRTVTVGESGSGRNPSVDPSPPLQAERKRDAADRKRSGRVRARRNDLRFIGDSIFRRDGCEPMCTAWFVNSTSNENEFQILCQRQERADPSSGNENEPGFITERNRRSSPRCHGRQTGNSGYGRNDQADFKYGTDRSGSCAGGPDTASSPDSTGMEKGPGRTRPDPCHVMVAPPRIELGTRGFSVLCSTI